MARPRDAVGIGKVGYSEPLETQLALVIGQQISPTIEKFIELGLSNIVFIQTKPPIDDFEVDRGTA